ncbi:unnamed protein product [Parajaminaea phylloscopi]
MLASITKRLRSQNLEDAAKDLQPPEIPEGELRLSPMDPAVVSQLQDAGVDLISCRSCPAPCDPGDAEITGEVVHPAKSLTAWSKQSVDLQGKMLGANKPFLRHALISTGKRDWPHDITSVPGSLACWFAEFAEQGKEAQPEDLQPDDEPVGAADEPPLPEGCWQTTLARTSRASPPPNPRPSRVLVGNASHVSSSRHHNGQTVLLFPDYVAVTDVLDGCEDPSDASDKADTRQVFNKVISGPPLGSKERVQVQASATVSKTAVQRWALPYAATIVLCSHNKRDARCGLAAPMLAEVFRRHAEAAGWEVDERGEHIAQDAREADGEVEFDAHGRPLNRGWGYIHEDDSTQSSSPQRPSPDQQLESWRRLAAASARPGADGHAAAATDESALTPTPPSLLILHTSHIGKHAWSGNVIVYFPNGAGVWYARVDPVNGGAGRVWEQTIMKGRVIPEYLRAGINLYRGPASSEHRYEAAKQHEAVEEKVSGLGHSLLRSTSSDAQAVSGPGILRW